MVSLGGPNSKVSVRGIDVQHVNPIPIKIMAKDVVNVVNDEAITINNIRKTYILERKIHVQVSGLVHDRDIHKAGAYPNISIIQIAT